MDSLLLLMTCWLLHRFTNRYLRMGSGLPATCGGWISVIGSLTGTWRQGEAVGERETGGTKACRSASCKDRRSGSCVACGVWRVASSVPAAR